MDSGFALPILLEFGIMSNLQPRVFFFSRMGNYSNFLKYCRKVTTEKFAWGLEIHCGFVYLLWDKVSIILGAAVIPSGVLSMVIFWLAFWFYNAFKNEPHIVAFQGRVAFHR